MFSALLPGLRDLRTPLVTGYLYLLAIWLTFGEERLWPEDASTFTNRLRELDGLIGASFTVAAISFAAYLLGSILTVRSTTTLERSLAKHHPAGVGQGPLRKLLSTPFNWAGTSAVSSRSGWLREVAEDLIRQGVTVERAQRDTSLPSGFVRWLSDLAEHQFPEEQARRAGLDPVDEQNVAYYRNEGRKNALMGAIAEHLQGREVEALLVRMQIERPALFDAYDRLKSESELRFSIFAPLVWLVGCSVILLSPWCLLLVSIPVVLASQGLLLQAQAQERITQALASGAIESPVLQRLRGMSSEDLPPDASARKRSTRIRFPREARS